MTIAIFVEKMYEDLALEKRKSMLYKYIEQRQVVTPKPVLKHCMLHAMLHNQYIAKVR